MKLEFSRQLFEKYSNIKFHENSSNGIRDGQKDGRRDMTKIIVVFRNFAREPKNLSYGYTLYNIMYSRLVQLKGSRHIVAYLKVR
jgi:hypothetical protein